MAACPNSSSGGGDTRYDFICTNGTPADGAAEAQNTTKCQSCNDGFNLTAAHTCVKYAYVCDNGTPSGDDATADNITQCQSCNDDFIITADKRCNHRYICNNGTPVEATDATGDNVTQCASCTSGYLRTDNNSCTNDLDNDGVINATDVDDDNDGLIEIPDLTALHNIRYNLAGTSYKTSSADAGDTAGAPTAGNKDTNYACSGTGLCGYELTHDLTFDKDGDGATFSRNSDGSYTLDSDDSASPYFVTAEGGWLPIGDSTTDSFRAIFEGNGHTISYLSTSRNQTYIGMFGSINTSAHIRNVVLVSNLADYNGNSGDNIYVGGLVGRQQDGYITASYVTGSASGGTGGYDSVGGLVGWQNNGSIISSYATGSVNDTAGTNNATGGLVGQQDDGSIIASYATGNVNSGDGNNDYSGGLVGIQEIGSIIASYATGNVNSGDGDNDYSGGLIGWQSGGSSITASYATGNVNGGGGNNDFAGGLVGAKTQGYITASYATGNVTGGGGTGDYVGKLIGISTFGPHTASYGFGTASGETSGIDGTTLPNGVTTANDLTASNATAAVCVGIANPDAYTTSGTCTATAKTACSWFSSTKTCSGTVNGIQCTVFSSQSTCEATTKTAGTWSNNAQIWNIAGYHTAGVWDFGTSSQTPALRYSDYDGSGNTYACNQFPASVTCGTTLLPGQR